HARIFDRPSVGYLNEEVMTASEKILDEAEQLAENNEVRFRVQVTRLPVWYVKIANHRVNDDARTELGKRFVTIARKAGVSNISEGKSLGKWAKKEGFE